MPWSGSLGLHRAPWSRSGRCRLLLGLGRVFTANMTENMVLLAFGAAGEQGLSGLAQINR